jgi:hypothetical protein
MRALRPSARILVRPQSRPVDFRQHAPPSADGNLTQQHVLGDGLCRHDTHFLRNDDNTGLERGRGRGVAYVNAIDPKFAAIRLIDPAKNLHQRRFTSSVFADQRVDFTRIDIERNVIKRLRRQKPFRNSACGCQGSRHGQWAAIQSIARGTQGPSTSPPARLAPK